MNYPCKRQARLAPLSPDFIKVIFIAQAKCPAGKKMCQKGHKTQIKGDKISKISLKEVFLLFGVQKPEFCASCGKLCADVRLCVCYF